MGHLDLVVVSYYIAMQLAKRDKQIPISVRKYARIKDWVNQHTRML